ncbi:MAG: hypothetical protein ACXAEN_16015 [Candidatus Thorarchaeota archaeon]
MKLVEIGQDDTWGQIHQVLGGLNMKQEEKSPDAGFYNEFSISVVWKG